MQPLLAIEAARQVQRREHGNRTAVGVAKEAAALVVNQVELIGMIVQIIENALAVFALALLEGIGSLRRVCRLRAIGHSRASHHRRRRSFGVRREPFRAPGVSSICSAPPALSSETGSSG